MNPLQRNILPVSRTKKEAQKSYDRLSHVYDWLVAAGEKRYRTAGLDLLNIQPGERVLEIGFGTGLALVQLARQTGLNGMVTGIDLSYGMHRVAEKRLRQEGLEALVSRCCGDAVQLPYTPGLFDALFMGFTLELFDTPEIPVVLAECLRVLRPGGRIGIVSLSRAEPRSLITKIYEWGHTKLPSILDCRPIYAVQDLSAAGFIIKRQIEMTYFGLSVVIALAVKRPG